MALDLVVSEPVLSMFNQKDTYSQDVLSLRLGPSSFSFLGALGHSL